MEEQESYYLGIDVGGTNTRAGIVTGSAESLVLCENPTDAERGPEAGVQNICSTARQAIRESGLDFEQIRGVGLATPGTMDLKRGMLLEPPNLPGWVNVPIRQQVEDELGIQTVLQNDANAAAYGEFWAGAGSEAHSLVFWTLGTGVGCGIIIGDLILTGEHSHGAECGHIIIEMDNGRRCNTGQYGTLEAYASATALVQRCREALDSGRQTELTRMLDAGEELTALLISEAAEQGDSLANELVMETARYLGVGTTTLMHTIDPDMVLIGGAMTFGRDEKELGRRFLERIQQEVRQRAFPVPARETVIDFATLGGDAGYIGAAGCARLAFRKAD